jgi:glycosyltransferase involved in cell wall biosynthesis
MVIVPDRLSDLVSKGEITDRYYNPGDVFDEVHLVMTNGDRPDLEALQVTVGNATLHLHNLPVGEAILRRTFGYRPHFLRPWAAGAVDLARQIRPRLVRCHGAWLNAFAAYEIRRLLGVPYIVSLHINPDEDIRRRARGARARVDVAALETIERLSLQHADLVLPVYEAIIPYLNRLRVSRYEVAYNMLNPGHLRVKDDYTLHQPVRVISVGRQFPEKYPDRLIRAVDSLPGVELTLIGDGPSHHDLRRLAEQLSGRDRFRFEPAVPNAELCARLPEYDVFATHTEYWEISKSVLEPLVTGLPLIINRRHGLPVPELTADICVLVDNTTGAYAQALRELIEDDRHREELGRNARRQSHERWAPEQAEARLAHAHLRTALPL